MEFGEKLESPYGILSTIIETQILLTSAKPQKPPGPVLSIQLKTAYWKRRLARSPLHRVWGMVPTNASADTMRSTFLPECSQQKCTSDICDRQLSEMRIARIPEFQGHDVLRIHTTGAPNSECWSHTCAEATSEASPNQFNALGDLGGWMHFYQAKQRRRRRNLQRNRPPRRCKIRQALKTPAAPGNASIALRISSNLRLFDNLNRAESFYNHYCPP